MNPTTSELEVEIVVVEIVVEERERERESKVPTLKTRDQNSPSLEKKQRRHREHLTGDTRPAPASRGCSQGIEHPRISHSPRSAGEVTGVEHDHEHQNSRSK
jgi:hypothetical protein